MFTVSVPLRGSELMNLKLLQLLFSLLVSVPLRGSELMNLLSKIHLEKETGFRPLAG